MANPSTVLESPGPRAARARHVRPLAIAAVAAVALILAQDAGAAPPAHVQSRASESTSGTQSSVAFASANSAGNLIVVYVDLEQLVRASRSRTLRGNTLRRARRRQVRWNNNTWSSQVFYAKNIGAGANTVRATFSSAINSFGIVYAHEYSGLDQVNPLDVSAAATGDEQGDEQRLGDDDQRERPDLRRGCLDAHGDRRRAPASRPGARDFGNRTEDRVATHGAAPTERDHDPERRRHGSCTWSPFKADRRLVGHDAADRRDHSAAEQRHGHRTSCR